jgi:hypothetical protein
MFKKLIANWKVPTPLKWRKIGTFFSIAADFIGTSTIIALPKFAWLGIVAFLAGLIGKELTNLFKEDPLKP